MKNLQGLLGNDTVAMDMMTYYAYNINEMLKAMNDMMEDMQGIYNFSVIIFQINVLLPTTIDKHL